MLKQQPELEGGMPVEFDINSVIVSNKQFVSHYGIRNIISHETKHWTVFN